MHSLSVCNRRIFYFKRLKARRHPSLNTLVSCSSSIETNVPSHRIVFEYGDRLEWRGDRPNDPGLTMLIVTPRFPETKRIRRAKISRPNLRVFVMVVHAKYRFLHASSTRSPTARTNHPTSHRRPTDVFLTYPFFRSFLNIDVASFSEGLLRLKAACVDDKVPGEPYLDLLQTVRFAAELCLSDPEKFDVFQSSFEQILKRQKDSVRSGSTFHARTDVDTRFRDMQT